MPDDNIIDFGSLKKGKPAPKNEVDSSDEAAFQAEMEDMFSKIPAHMQDYIGQRYTRLMMYTMITTCVAETLLAEGYDPDNFEPDEESTEAFLSAAEDLPDDEDEVPVWNGPLFDWERDGEMFRVATAVLVSAEDEDGLSVSADILKHIDGGKGWLLWDEGEWKPGPPEWYFDYLSMMRDGLYEEDDEEAPESVYDLELPPGVLSTLTRNGIDTVEDLCGKTKVELMSLKGIGRRSVEMIEEELEYYGLGLKK